MGWESFWVRPAETCAVSVRSGGAVSCGTHKSCAHLTRHVVRKDVQCLLDLGKLPSFEVGCFVRFTSSFAALPPSNALPVRRSTSVVLSPLKSAASAHDALPYPIDAEGRLVLADALVEASSETPDILIDCATLTGAFVSKER